MQVGEEADSLSWPTRGSAARGRRTWSIGGVLLGAGMVGDGVAPSCRSGRHRDVGAERHWAAGACPRWDGGAGRRRAASAGAGGAEWLGAAGESGAALQVKAVSRCAGAASHVAPVGWGFMWWRQAGGGGGHRKNRWWRGAGGGGGILSLWWRHNAGFWGRCSAWRREFGRGTSA